MNASTRIGALARVEAVLLLRHPVILAALVIMCGYWIYSTLVGDTMNSFPVLQRADREIQVACALLMGTAALITANLATLRSQRHGTAAQFDVLVMTQERRTTAHLLALVPLGAVALVLTIARASWLASLPGAAGTPNVFELLTGPAAVLLLGSLGILLGRLVPTPLVAPFLAAGIMMISIIVALPGIGDVVPVKWLLPIAYDEDTTNPLPADLIGRPAGSHLIYLLAIMVVVCCVALLAGGGRRRSVKIMTAVAVASAIAAGTAQFVPAPAALTAQRTAATVEPAGGQQCETRSHVTYCAFAGYASWIGPWNDVVQGVLRSTPASALPGQLAVRQRVLANDTQTGPARWLPPAPTAVWEADDLRAGTSKAIVVGSVWGSPELEFELAANTAYRIVTGSGPYEKIAPLCGSRAVISLWLAFRATPTAAAYLKDLLDNGAGTIVFTSAGFGTGIAFNYREVNIVRQLLVLPAAQVAEKVTASWQELSAAATTTERASQIFGVRPPPTPVDPAGRC